MLAELDRHRDPEVADVLPSVFMKRVMNDESAPIHVRLVAAARVIPFVERKPAPGLPDAIPLFRDWSDEQYEDFERRLKEDAARDPHYYGPAFLEALGVPWPAQTKLPKGKPPSDRWFAEIDSKTDQRRHHGGPKPWDPDELAQALASPFTPAELAQRRIYEHPNGEDDPER